MRCVVPVRCVRSLETSSRVNTICVVLILRSHRWWEESIIAAVPWSKGLPNCAHLCSYIISTMAAKYHLQWCSWYHFPLLVVPGGAMLRCAVSLATPGCAIFWNDCYREPQRSWVC